MADAEQIEMHFVLGEVFEGAKRSFGCNSKIAKGAGLSNGPTDMERAIPLQRHLRRALTRLCSTEAEVGKLESFTARVQGDDTLTPRRTRLLEEKRHGLPRPELEPGASLHPLLYTNELWRTQPRIACNVRHAISLFAACF